MGNAAAQSNLAVLHYGTEAMLDLLRRSSAAKYPRALTNLGLAYLRGTVVDYDLALARSCFQQSAALGNPSGAYYYAHVLLQELKPSAKIRREAVQHILFAGDRDYHQATTTGIYLDEPWSLSRVKYYPRSALLAVLCCAPQALPPSLWSNIFSFLRRRDIAA